ncbi:unnamed protein product [Prunus brigantina]
MQCLPISKKLSMEMNTIWIITWLMVSTLVGLHWLRQFPNRILQKKDYLPKNKRLIGRMSKEPSEYFRLNGQLLGDLNICGAKNNFIQS